MKKNKYTDRKGLNIIRKLMREEIDKTKNKIEFNEISTIGYLVNRSGVQLSTEIITNIRNGVEIFIKNSGLMLNTITIVVEDGRLILNSETIKNPSLDSFKGVIIDTNNESPIINVISDSIAINDAYVDVVKRLNVAYKDKQIGRNKLINITQLNNI